MLLLSCRVSNKYVSFSKAEKLLLLSWHFSEKFPFFSPVLNMLVESLFSHMYNRNLIPLIPQLLFSLQICFTFTIFVFKLPSPPIWTSVLHLMLNSLQTLFCNSSLWGTYHYLDWLFHGSFPWFSFLSGFQPPLEWCLFSPEEIRISFWYLHLLCTSLKNITDAIYLKESEEISQKQYRKMINPLFPGQRDFQTNPV